MSKFKVDFIGIGSWKCGTTWIAHLLRQHPEVCFSRTKEPKFFNEFRMNGMKNPSYEKGMKHYREFWPENIPEDCAVGEFSPTYLPDKKAPKRIKKAFPGVKLLVILRNPIEKAYSLFLSRRNFAVDLPPDITFEEMIDKHTEFIEDCLYYPQLKRYYDLFPKDNIKVFLLENVKKNPDKVKEEVYSYVGVDKDFEPDMTPQNPTPVLKGTFITKLVKHILNIPIYFYRGTASLMPRKVNDWLLNSKLKDYYSRVRLSLLFSSMQKKDKKEPIKKDVRKKLKKYFSQDIKKLEKLTGLDLSVWK